MIRCSALTALAALATAAAIASPATASAAQPLGRGARMNVYYDLRDLSSERGIRSPNLRIVKAAREVCPGSDSRYVAVVAASKECERHAIARAVAQIGNERLAAPDARARGPAARTATSTAPLTPPDPPAPPDRTSGTRAPSRPCSRALAASSPRDG